MHLDLSSNCAFCRSASFAINLGSESKTKTLSLTASIIVIESMCQNDHYQDRGHQRKEEEEEEEATHRRSVEIYKIASTTAVLVGF